MMEHYWLSLPGPQWFSGAGIYAEQVARAKDGATFVELGSWKGRSASFMGVEIANSGKVITFFAVDHWIGSLEEEAHRNDEDVRNDRLFEAFMENIRPVGEHIRPIKMDTVSAARAFPDESIDFLYVDASHTYEGVKRDLKAWYPKVKKGGIIAGDDWMFQDPITAKFGVRNAVREFFGLRGNVITLLEGEPDRYWLQWQVEKRPGRISLRSFLLGLKAALVARKQA